MFFGQKRVLAFVFFIYILFDQPSLLFLFFSYFKVNIKLLYPVGINRMDNLSFKFIGFLSSLYLIHLPLPVPQTSYSFTISLYRPYIALLFLLS